MQQVSQGILSFCLSMHIIICISRYVWGCACMHTLIYKFLQDFKQKPQLCFFVGKDRWTSDQPNQVALLIRQVLTVSCVLPWLPYPHHPSQCTQILVSSTTAQIASQQQEKCFLSVGIQLGCEENSILRHFWTSLVFGAQSSCLQLGGQEGLGHLW